MSSGKAEQILDALNTLPSVRVQRNTTLPETLPAGVLIVIRDGDPSEPEQALAP